MSQEMIKIEHVGMDFNIANQKLNSLKEYAIALIQRKLIYNPFTALDDINITINKGEVYGIVGTNGSGKSTLLKLIAGVLDPTRGNIEINGTIAPLIELGAGTDEELSCVENAYLTGSLLGLSKHFIDRKLDSILSFAELQDFADMPLKNYSSGMKARFAFALTTCARSDILLCDEILSVGDGNFQLKCEHRIKDMVKNGTTLLFVSHSIEQVERVCDKALWIEKGKMQMAGNVHDVCDAYRYACEQMRKNE